MKDCNTYIVHNGVRYQLVQGRDCTNHCSFRKADGPYYCERGCYLPSWFKRLRIGVDCWLERADPKVERIKKVKGGCEMKASRSYTAQRNNHRRRGKEEK